MQYIKNIITFLLPPEHLKLIAIIISGTAIGLGAFIVYISNMPSYLSDKPETCVNCHVMNSQYASWQHSSHRQVATCNDCHVPHTSEAAKYYFKAKDGMRHATIFTMRAEPQVIQIKDAGVNVVQENCKRCHADLISMVSICEVTGENHTEGKGHRCWDCHREVPHGTVNSLASSPNSLVPQLPSIAPKWLETYLKRSKKGKVKAEK